MGLLVFASYRVYHPLNSPGTSEGGGSGGRFSVVRLNNSGFADLTILRVEGGVLGSYGPSAPARLPYTVRARGGTDVFVKDVHCGPRSVTVTFSVLGRTSAQQFTVPSSGCRG